MSEVIIKKNRQSTKFSIRSETVSWNLVKLVKMLYQTI